MLRSTDNGYAKIVEQSSVKWMPWAIGEGVNRAINKPIAKIVGLQTAHLGALALSTCIIGLVQVLAGLIVCRIKRVSLIPSWRLVVWCVAFGLGATACTILMFIAFALGADTGVYSLIIALAIVPGALVDKIVFRHSLTWLQWLSVIIACCGAYAALDFPNLIEVKGLPSWVWISFAIMLIVAANQGFTQAAREVDPFVKNIWGGGTTVATTLPIVLWTAPWQEDLSLTFWAVSVLLGFLVISLWTFNLMSYKSGAWIAYKKLVVTGTYLALVTFSGAVAFDEPITVGKLVGIALFLIALRCMEPKREKS